ncbi:MULTISPECIES: hypothetical protein [Mycobacteroides]|uniref:Secreted protein n=1 Tax=Mycobacteroides chelonae TaxID=1774 RepID=A0AB73LFI5_MYCCH|nr:MULTISPECIES: hypothetical protein [Mycobacteroides]KRQ28106.1 hypothetical protein AOT86_09420 [Mycobacteroides sp. H072]KRQ34050.1 hypothetical protein AOT84_19095 [Mycobacteroides sp. H002]KRQ53709.1 hypothetical protein AOT85_06525 [Mycobacteroides sp. H054]KRQ66606.1 hypothetical protein AOT83_22000 [Mycobacteroides sp. H001]MBF9326137.1 hypothetical protein [Mycobacteroides chelonae]
MKSSVRLGVCASVALLCATTVSAGSAAADPPSGFPDISGLPAVESRQYFSVKVYRFATPDGVLCESAGWNPYFQWTCIGPKGSGSAQLDLGSYARNNGTPATVGESQGNPDLSRVPVLPGNHQVRIAAPVHNDDGSQTTLTCATPAPKTTACLVDDLRGTHGFVLSPERNWAF